MRWRELSAFSDPGAAKLDALRRAAAAGLRVPPTVWAHARNPPADLPAGPPAAFGPPWIVRSASPDEDTEETSNAGQRLSLGVERAEDFAAAVRDVAATAAGGAVFVQPLLAPERAGVAFFDAWWYERTEARGSNADLTSGRARGEVVRGHRERGDAWSAWLDAVWAVFARDGALDVEYARDGDAFTLLQVRPALFAVRRNPTLSLANHREILGDPPSPWIVSVLEHAGRDAPRWFARVDRATARWNEPYAETFASRSWMNFSYFFRLMDRWGLPRAFVTEGVGGKTGRPADRRFVVPRMLANAPRLLALQARALHDVARLPAGLRAVRRRLARADTLRELFDANVFALAFALRSNFAINAVWSGVARLRRALGLKGRARVVTEAMMDEFDALRGDPAGLDAWLERYGHRGPLESDPAQPRFAEMRDALRADLERPAAARAVDGDASGGASGSATSSCGSGRPCAGVCAPKASPSWAPRTRSSGCSGRTSTSPPTRSRTPRPRTARDTPPTRRSTCPTPPRATRSRRAPVRGRRRRTRPGARSPASRSSPRPCPARCFGRARSGTCSGARCPATPCSSCPRSSRRGPSCSGAFSPSSPS